MALRNILHDDDPALRKKSRKVEVFNERIHELIDDMRETLQNANGIGLAAPQVGVLRRIVLVVDVENEDEENDAIIELINPEIIETSGEQEGLEGCLSVPGVWGIVERPDYVKVRAFDRFGNEFEVDGKMVTARAFCHEIDHLEGKIFTELAKKLLNEDELNELLAEDEPDEDEECE